MSCPAAFHTDTEMESICPGAGTGASCVFVEDMEVRFDEEFLDRWKKRMFMRFCGLLMTGLSSVLGDGCWFWDVLDLRRERIESISANLSLSFGPVLLARRWLVFGELGAFVYILGSSLV